jgi:two-component system, LytTR family, response regulator
MRVMIVDDEPLARKALENVLATRNDVETFDCAEDAVEALEKLQKKPYDVILLDIHMPELSGIEFVDCMNQRNWPMPAVIFVTAHHEHAIAAFEKHAVDYVLKPFSDKRIQEALDVAMRRTSREREIRLLEILSGLKARLSKPSNIAIKVKGRIILVDPAEVVAVEAEGNYVLLQRPSGSHLLRGSISTLAEKLEPYGFVRIHRSVLINGACVQEIQPWSTGECLLRVKGGKEYTVSRTYKANLKSLAQFWLGSDALSAD